MKVQKRIWAVTIIVFFLMCRASWGDFLILDSSDRNVAVFDSQGNLYLKGNLDESTTHTAGANDEFRFQDPTAMIF